MDKLHSTAQDSMKALKTRHILEECTLEHEVLLKSVLAVESELEILDKKFNGWRKKLPSEVCNMPLPEYRRLDNQDRAIVVRKRKRGPSPVRNIINFDECEESEHLSKILEESGRVQYYLPKDQVKSKE